MLRLTIQYKKLWNFRTEIVCATRMSRHIMIHSHITGFPPLLSLIQCTGCTAVSWSTQILQGGCCLYDLYFFCSVRQCEGQVRVSLSLQSGAQRAQLSLPVPELLCNISHIKWIICMKDVLSILCRLEFEPGTYSEKSAGHSQLWTYCFEWRICYKKGKVLWKKIMRNSFI